MKSREVGQQLFVRWNPTAFVARIAALSGSCRRNRTRRIGCRS